MHFCKILTLSWRFGKKPKTISVKGTNKSKNKNEYLTFLAAIQPEVHYYSLYVSVIPTLYVTYNSDADIDECSTNSHSFDVNAVCSNTVGSHARACKARFTGDGKTLSGKRLWCCEKRFQNDVCACMFTDPIFTFKYVEKDGHNLNLKSFEIIIKVKQEIRISLTLTLTKVGLTLNIMSTRVTLQCTKNNNNNKKRQ